MTGFEMNARRDVVVVGGGQAGIAVARLLPHTGLSFVVLDAGGDIGESWRRRYKGLTLFTPRAYSGLPDMAMSGDPTGYPDGDEFASYLKAYADHFRLPVQHGSAVGSLTRNEEGEFLLRGNGFGPLRADAVIVAAGAFRDPVVPSWASRLPPDLPATAAEAFGDGSHLPLGPLLIVGDGASGRDIAMLARSKREVTLATGRPRRLLPERLLGRSLWWWLDVTGLLRAPARSFLGRLMRRTDPFPNRKRRLTDLSGMGITVKPRAVGFADGKVLFADASSVRPAAIVWAIGYQPDWSFIEIENALDDAGGPRHQEGRSPVDGLYYVGLPWQRNRASGLVMGMGEDAAFVIGHLLERHLLRNSGEDAPHAKTSITPG